MPISKYIIEKELGPAVIRDIEYSSNADVAEDTGKRQPKAGRDAALVSQPKAKTKACSPFDTIIGQC